MASDDHPLDRADALVDDVRRKLSKAAKEGVIEPSLADKLCAAQQQITKGDPRITVEVHGDTDEDTPGDAHD